MLKSQISAKNRVRCMMGWSVSAEKKDMYPLLFDAESIPGVGFSIWGSREGELKIWKTLTLSRHNSILGRDGVVLKVNFSSGNVLA